MSVRLSPATVKVLQVMTKTASARQYGYSLMRATALKSGSLYPILERLERAGWVESEWETADEQQPGRPPRRYYRLTALGREEAPQAVAGYLGKAEPSGTPGKRPVWEGVR